MIPGFIISWVTFPGVIVHELAHAIFCRLFGIKIYKICYFKFSVGFGQPAGYVLHEPSVRSWQQIFVGIGPFIVNTLVGAVIAAPAALRYQLGGLDLLDIVLLWLGISISMHAFPSTGDAKVIWRSVTASDTPMLTKVLGVPIVGLIYAGALGSIFWLDALYGVAVAGFFPWLLVKLLA